MSDTGSIDRRGVGIATETFEALGMAFREQNVRDFGIDAHVELVENGRPTGRILGVQLKTGASYFEEASSDGFWFRFTKRHKEYWTDHSLPVLVLLCDPSDRSIYWQRIAHDTVESTGDGWKIMVPRAQVVGPSSAADIRNAATRIAPAHLYSVTRLEDVSHATAKRYSLDIVLSGAPTKAEIASVIRQVTLATIGERYYRDKNIEARWGDTDAHVVWTFVYASVQDAPNANWLCQSLWVDPTLPDSDSPIRIVGENIGLSTIVEWSQQYRERAEIFARAAVSKRAFLSEVDRTCSRLHELLQPLTSTTGRAAVPHQRIREQCVKIEGEVETLYERGIALGVPPVECTDLNAVFQQVILAAHNVVLPFAAWTKGTWPPSNQVSIAMEGLKSFFRQLPKFQFEREKVR